jgi:homoserine/homoserine lactone efflux protein
MLSTELSLFFSVTFIVSASPGPVMLSCMTNGGRYGITKSLEGMLGASLGNLFLVGLSALGLGVIVHNSDFLFSLIKYLGAFYLVYLGIQTIRDPVASAIDLTNNTHTPSEKQSANTSAKRSLLLSSFLIAISNPKGLIYFGALFPQFLNYAQPLPKQFAVLIIGFLIMDLLWMLVYAAAGNRMMAWLKTPRHKVLFNTASGVTLIVVGLLLASTGK